TCDTQRVFSEPARGWPPTGGPRGDARRPLIDDPPRARKRPTICKPARRRARASRQAPPALQPHDPTRGPSPPPALPARFRLSPLGPPTAYDPPPEPDLPTGRFAGEVRIGVRLEKPRPEITLHAADLAVTHAAARVGDAEVAARRRLDRADETVTL